MRTEVTIHGSTSPAAHYVGWSPVQAQVRLTQADGATAPVAVTVHNRNALAGGQLVFWAGIPGPAAAELPLSLPVDGSPVLFFVGGQFGRPSTRDRDAAIEVLGPGGQVTSITQLMVRVRKDANTLTSDERNRFRSALATLNDRGMGAFTNFRDMHVNAATDEGHGLAGFLPWHRAYLLDLERELQAIDPSVSLPYWRFDRPAPRVFNGEFLGVTTATGLVQFSAANPLQFWATDQSVGVVRRPQFNAQQGAPNLLGEAATLALGGAGILYEPFRSSMEGNPHGSAHTSFTGFIASLGTAARDPLFFLLHANVDRLWAKWQWLNRRFDPTSRATYGFLGAAGNPGSIRVGHNLRDTMWPWNQVTTPPRPPAAPGGAFPPSLLANAPGSTPKVSAMIDYQGVLFRGARLGFDYDDVPFEF